MAALYKTFSQSIMLFGFEVLNYSVATMNELNVRQNIFIKNTIGLSKYVKTKPLFNALKIKSMQQLIYQHKLSFVRQLHKVDFTKQIFEYLSNKYSDEAIPKDSFFCSYNKIISKCGLELNKIFSKTEINKNLNKYFGFENDRYGLVDSITTVLERFDHYREDGLALLLLSNLLAVTRNNDV